MKTAKRDRARDDVGRPALYPCRGIDLEAAAKFHGRDQPVPKFESSEPWGKSAQGWKPSGSHLGSPRGFVSSDWAASTPEGVGGACPLMGSLGKLW